MNALNQQATTRRVTRLAIAAVALTALVGCDEVSPISPLTQSAATPEVTVSVSSNFVLAGDEVRLDLFISVPERLESGQIGGKPASLRATVSWDASAFQYIDGQGHDLLGGDPADGWMILEVADLELLLSGRIGLRFVALLDSDTSEFDADAVLLVDDEAGGVVN